MSQSWSQFRLGQLPVTVKIVLTATIVLLGVGYAIALFNLYLTYAMTDGEPGLSANDLKRAFYGNRDNTRLASKIHGGSMEQFLPKPGDKEKVLSWIQDGATEAGYQRKVRPILEQNCIRCHNPAGLSSFRPLTSYQEVMEVVQIDRGEPVNLWARVAHTHLQSIGLIFLVLTFMFSFSGIRQGWKIFWVALPYLSLVADFAFRFGAKHFPNLVYGAMTAGSAMGLAFGVLTLVSLYEIWLKRPR